MKKWIVYLCCLLAGVGGFAGCSDDDIIIRDDFSSTEGEKIDFVLDDVPACIIGIGDSCVAFCYADYAYEYYFEPNSLANFSTDEYRIIDENIMNKRFLISYDNFKEFGMDLSSGTKVFVSAKITNIGSINDNRDWQELIGRVPIIRKAYLTGLRVNNN